MTGNTGTPAAAFQSGESWTLSDLLPGILSDPNRGLQATGWPGTSNLSVPLGTLRDPVTQVQSTFAVDFSHWAGNLGVTGAAQSGKTTLLRTLICGLALTHTPAEVQVYGLESEDGLRAVAGLPHVGAFADRRDPDRAAQIAWLAADIVDQRRELFAQAGIDSMDVVRAFTRSGQGSDDPFGDVFVVIDDWSGVIRRFPGAEAPLLRIAASGLRFGVHLTVAADTLGDLPSAVRRRLTAQIELAPGDAREQEFAAAVNTGVLPLGRPGCALAPGPGFLSVALPRIDGARTAHDLSAGLAGLVSHITQNWHGQPAPAPDPAHPYPILRTGGGRELGGLAEILSFPGEPGPALSKVVMSDQVRQPRPDPDYLNVPIGVAVDGTLLNLDLKRAAEQGLGPHALVTGPRGSGKTTLLRTIVSALALAHPADQVQVLLVDSAGEGNFELPAAADHLAGKEQKIIGGQEQVDLLSEMISEELDSREKRFREAKVPSLREYRDARQGNPALEPIPNLMIVIDDADQLLDSHPGFQDALRRIGRDGRNGMHIILAAESLADEGWNGRDVFLAARIELGGGEEGARPGSGSLVGPVLDSRVPAQFRAFCQNGPIVVRQETTPPSPRPPTAPPAPVPPEAVPAPQVQAPPAEPQAPPLWTPSVPPAGPATGPGTGGIPTFTARPPS